MYSLHFNFKVPERAIRVIKGFAFAFLFLWNAILLFLLFIVLVSFNINKTPLWLLFFPVFLLVFGNGIVIVPIVINDSRKQYLKKILKAKRLPRTVRSDTGKKLLLRIIMVLCFNVFMLPIVISVLQKDSKLHIAIGLMLFLIYANSKTAIDVFRFFRFGDSKLILDNNPCYISGPVGGFMYVDLPYDSCDGFKATITCRIYRPHTMHQLKLAKEEVIFEQSTNVYRKPCMGGTELSFKFDLQGNGEPTGQAFDGYDYCWVVTLASGNIPGADFYAEFDIVVNRAWPSDELKEA